MRSSPEDLPASDDPALEDKSSKNRDLNLKEVRFILLYIPRLILDFSFSGLFSLTGMLLWVFRSYRMDSGYSSTWLAGGICGGI